MAEAEYRREHAETTKTSRKKLRPYRLEDASWVPEYYEQHSQLYEHLFAQYKNEGSAFTDTENYVLEKVSERMGELDVKKHHFESSNKCFYQAYCTDLSVFKQMSKKQATLFYELLHELKWKPQDQTLFITPGLRKRLVKNLGKQMKFYQSTFSKTLAALCESGLLYKVSSHSYQLNPLHFGFMHKDGVKALREEHSTSFANGADEHEEGSECHEAI